MAEFDDLFANAVQTIKRPTPTTLDLTIASTAEATAKSLAERETACCSFFTFDFRPASDSAPASASESADTLVLRVAVPEGATYLAVLDAVESRARDQLSRSRSS